MPGSLASGTPLVTTRLQCVQRHAGGGGDLRHKVSSDTRTQVASLTLNAEADRHTRPAYSLKSGVLQKYAFQNHPVHLH